MTAAPNSKLNSYVLPKWDPKTCQACVVKDEEIPSIPQGREMWTPSDSYPVPGLWYQSLRNPDGWGEDGSS